MKSNSDKFRARSRELREENSLPASCTLAIKAIPNAPRTEIVGWLGNALKIKVHAPPLEGRANEVLCKFLADHLDLPRRAVNVLRGDTSRQKTVQITGLPLAAVLSRLPTKVAQ